MLAKLPSATEYVSKRMILTSVDDHGRACEPRVACGLKALHSTRPVVLVQLKTKTMIISRKLGSVVVMENEVHSRGLQNFDTIVGTIVQNHLSKSI